MRLHYILGLAIALWTQVASASENSCGLRSATRLTTLRVLAAEPMHVEERNCKITPPTNEEIKARFASRDASEVERLFAALVPRRSQTENFAGCRDVICKIERVFGNEVGVKLLYLLDRYGLNGSHLRFQNADAWTAEELEPILQALHDFPRALERFDRPLIRYKRNSTLRRYQIREQENPGSCVGADADENGATLFFDCYFRQVRELQQATAFHELSHVIGDRGNIDRSTEWRALSGWRDVNGIPVAENDACLTSTNAAQSEDEDFASAMETYRYDPARLLASCPGKYAFIRDRVFGGVEYLNSVACPTDSRRN